MIQNLVSWLGACICGLGLSFSGLGLEGLLVRVLEGGVCFSNALRIRRFVDQGIN